MPNAAKRGGAICATLFATFALLLGGMAPAGADTVGSGAASAYGATIAAGGQEVVPPTPLAEATLDSEDVSETVVDVPAEPLAVSGTLNADAAVHAESDIDSALTVVSQEVEGPYNASGVALIEGAEVLVDAVAEDVSLVTADVIRAEAVAVCTAGEVVYSANSEIISLQIGGEDVPLNAPIQDLLDAVSDGLEQSGLNQVVDIQRNVITPTEDGIAVDALVVTLLAAAGDPVAEVRLGHAEVSGTACAAEEVVTPAAPVVPDEATPTPQQLPQTGSSDATTVGLAAAMALGALTIGFLRRRVLR